MYAKPPTKTKFQLSWCIWRAECTHSFTCDRILFLLGCDNTNQQANQNLCQQKNLKTYGLWWAQVLETSQHCLRLAVGPWLLKWLKDSLCVDLERHLGCAEQFALCFAKELGVQWFTVAICELEFLWTIKPSLLFLQEV